MIFVTVGTQEPFPRLIEAVDEWASMNTDIEVVAQVGEDRPKVRSLRCVSRLSPEAFTAHVKASDVLVGHAGIGTILAAAEHRRPLVVMPRRAELGEHRNEHQLATIDRLGHLGFAVVDSSDELRSALGARDRVPVPTAGNGANDELVAHVRGILSKLTPGQRARRSLFRSRVNGR